MGLKYVNGKYVYEGAPGGGGHSSLTFTDRYGTTQHAENAAQKDAFLQAQNNKYLRRELQQYDANANPYAADLMRQFGQQIQFGIGQQSGGVMSGINQFLTRRGIDPRRSGIAASLHAQQLGALQQQGQQAQLSFNQRLLGAMQNDRNAVLTGTLSFFQALDRMNYQNELNKDFARFQQEMQTDQNRWNALGKVVGLGSQVIAGLFGGGMTGGELSYSASSGPLPGEFGQMDPVYR